MDIKQKVENYLIQGNWVFNRVNDLVWVINDEYEGIDNLVLYYQEPLVVLRLKLMEIPKNNKEAFFKKLLELNATMLHGAYAIEGNNIVVVDTLEAENLDFNELKASIEAIYMAITQDYKILKEFMK